MTARSVRAALTNALLSFAVGLVLWVTSPWFTDRREPWDSGNYYLAALLLLGFLVGLARPRPLWAHPVGFVLGQLTFMLIALPIGNMLPLGVVFLVLWSLPYLGAAAGGARLRRFVTRKR